MSKDQQNYILWDLLNNERITRVCENEYGNGKTAFTTTTFMDMLYRHVFKSILSGKLPDLLKRNLQKSFIDALITAVAENERVKINKELYEGDILASAQRHLTCEHGNCLNSKSGDIMLTNGQVSRNSDTLSLKCGEVIRVMKLLKMRMGSANSAVRLHYEDMILRVQMGSGLTEQV